MSPSRTSYGRSSSCGCPVSEKAVTLTTTRERLDALRQHLGKAYLGHKPVEELVRALLADIDRALGS